MKIKMSQVSKILGKLIEVFEEEDQDYPNNSIVRSKERAINNVLNKITNDKVSQSKIVETIRHGMFGDDRTYVSICNGLRELGYKIVEGE